MDGLPGVAGMMTLLVMTGIIPETSLRKTHQEVDVDILIMEPG
jgi:hypothetical protein